MSTYQYFFTAPIYIFLVTLNSRSAFFSIQGFQWYMRCRLRNVRLCHSSFMALLTNQFTNNK